MPWSLRTYWTILIGAAIWCSLLLLAPACIVSTSPFLHSLGCTIYGLFRPLCHQLDSRSFHLSGAPVAVCVRCTAIYCGFLCGVLAYPLLREIGRPLGPGRTFIVVAIAPMVLDVTATMVGVHEATNLTRALTGAWLGCLLPFCVIPGTIEGVGQILEGAPPHQQKKGLTDA